MPTILKHPFWMSQHISRTSTTLTQHFWMSWSNVCHPQAAFPDVLSVCIECVPSSHSFSGYQTRVLNIKYPHTISGCQNVYPERPPSSNSFFRYKNGCTEHITQPFQMSKHRYSMSTIPLSACIKHPQSVISEVKEHLLKLNHPHPPSNSFVVMSKHVYRMSTRRQNACPKVYNSQTVFPDVKMQVPNVYHPHPAFLDVQINVPNVCHPPTAFPDGKTHVRKIYLPWPAVMDVKTCVTNVFQPHTAFLDVKMLVRNVYHPQMSTILTEAFLVSKRVYQTSIILKHSFQM